MVSREEGSKRELDIEYGRGIEQVPTTEIEQVNELELTRKDLQLIHQALQRVANDYGHRLKRIHKDAEEAKGLSDRVHRYLTTRS